MAESIYAEKRTGRTRFRLHTIPKTFFKPARHLLVLQVEMQQLNGSDSLENHYSWWRDASTEDLTTTEKPHG